MIDRYPALPDEALAEQWDRVTLRLLGAGGPPILCYDGGCELTPDRNDTNAPDNATG